MTMPNPSKRYRSATEKADLSQPHQLEQAIEVLDQMEKVKFDETVELSVALGVDPKQTSQSVRGTVNLPHGSGRKVVVAVFTEKPDEAKAAVPDAIVATGRSDFPNQVNNVLGFPFIFRGALDVRARQRNSECPCSRPGGLGSWERSMKHAVTFQYFENRRLSVFARR